MRMPTDYVLLRILRKRYNGTKRLQNKEIHVRRRILYYVIFVVLA